MKNPERLLLTLCAATGISACGGGGGAGQSASGSPAGTAPVAVANAVPSVGGTSTGLKAGTHEGVFLMMTRTGPAALALGPVIVAADTRSGGLRQSFSPTDATAAAAALTSNNYINWETSLRPYSLVMDAQRNLIEDFDGCSYWRSETQVSIPLMPDAGSAPDSVKVDGLTRRCAGQADAAVNLRMGRTEGTQAGIVESGATITIMANGTSRFQMSSNFFRIPVDAQDFPASARGKVLTSVGVTRYDGGTAHFHQTLSPP